MTDASSPAVPRGVFLLAASGLLPFAAALGLALMNMQWRGMALLVFIGYGALILSFIGGTRWGRSMAHALDTSHFVESVLPSLLAFVAMLMIHKPTWSLVLLAVGFAIWLVIDIRDPLWSRPYRWMRWWISLPVLAMHAAWIPLLSAH
jgi:hypothetical protein